MPGTKEPTNQGRSKRTNRSRTLKIIPLRSRSDGQSKRKKGATTFARKNKAKGQQARNEQKVKGTPPYRTEEQQEKGET